MNFWQQAPFARILLPFVCGILSSLFLHLPLEALAAVTLLAFVSYTVLFFYVRTRIRQTAVLLTGVILIVLCWSLGACWHRMYHQLSKPNHFSHTSSLYKVVDITEAPVKKARTIKLTVEVNEVKTTTGLKRVRGKMMLYVQRDSAAEQLKYGDRLLLRVRERLVEEPRNPEEFNYKRYLMFNNIFHQAYVTSADYRLLKREVRSALFAAAFQTRDRLIDLFRTHVQGEREFAVSTALVFGYVDELDPDLIQSYSNTGTLHVLAVSGMHVGIIYLVLNWVFAFMDRNRKTALLKACGIGLFLWGYSMVAGLSPSILRAATMFSFITFGQLINRRTQIYNTLAASAFILILFKPTIIASVGFQLSYAAVLGIVFIQPKLYRLLLFRNYIADLIWKITAVSIAAQVTTFPLGLLYFHQFPNYFIFSNLIIIPLTTVVLYVGIVLIVFSWQATLASWIGQVVFWGIKVTNLLVESIDRLPYATVNGISISIPETLVIYVILFTGIGYVLLKRIGWLQLCLVCSVLLASLNLYEKNEQLYQQQRIIYHIPGHRAIAVFNGMDALLLCDSALAADAAALRFYIRHHWWERGQLHIRTRVMNEQTNYLLQLHGKRVLWLQHGKGLKHIPPQPLDVIILSNNAWVDMTQLRRDFNPEQLIFDGSNRFKKIGFWKREAQRVAVPYTDVTSTGAVVLN